MSNPGLIDKYAARVLMISFFLPMTMQVVVALPVSLYFAIRTFKDHGQIPAGNYLWAITLGSLFFGYLLTVPLSASAFREGAWQICGNRISLLLFPLVCAIITPQRRKVIFNELAWFVYCCFLLTLAGNVYFICKYGLSATGFKGVNHVTYRVYFEWFTGLHPTYLSLYLVFSMCILMMNDNRINRVAKYLLFYSLLLFLVCLLAKAPLIAMALIFMHYAWTNRWSLWQKHKWFIAGIALIITASYAFVPFVSQRVKEMSGLSAKANGDNFMDNSINVRKMIWNIDTTMLRHYWLTGTGPARLMHLLRERYFFYSLQMGTDLSFYDPHNEYFYNWLSLGLAGILLLAITLLFHFLTAIRHKQHLYFYLLLLIAITFFTESVLGRQQGVIFYSFFMSLLFFYTRDTAKQRAITT